MYSHFRLTFAWHVPRITFGPATIAPIGGASLRRIMAAAPLREEKSDKVERMDDRLDKERAKAVEMAIGQIEKQFGKGSIMRLGGKDAIAPIPAISTGSISIDWALGVGGLPRGRVIEVFGPESSGKTLALQRSRRRRSWASRRRRCGARARRGLCPSSAWISKPAGVAADNASRRWKSGPHPSTASTSCRRLGRGGRARAEIEGEMGEAQMGLQARLMSRAAQTHRRRRSRRRR